MKRNLRALGPALLAAFAISAVVASAAQAIKVTTGASPAVLTGSPVGTTKFTINPNTPNATASFECTTIGGSATVVSSGQTELTLSNVSFGGCTAKIGVSTAFITVDMEGCDFKLHGGVQDAENHFKEGEADLACPGTTTGPVITIFSDAAHTTRICKYTVWNFTNHKEVTATNTAGTPDDIDAKLVNLGVNVTRNEGILCPKPDEQTVLNGEATIKAYEDIGGSEGAQIGVTISS